MRSEAFECVRQRSASGVHWRSAFARRSRGVREAFARRSRGVREAFATRSRRVWDARSKGRRSEAFEGVRKRSKSFENAWLVSDFCGLGLAIG